MHSGVIPGITIVYASLLPAEEVPLFHACPGGTVFRVVLPGSPVSCNACRWADIVDTAGLELKQLNLDRLGFLSVSRPNVLLVDGPEPLTTGWPEVAELHQRAKEASRGSIEFSVIASMGLVDADRLEEARSAGYRGVLFEYLLHIEKITNVSRLINALKKAYEVFDVVEILVPLGEPRRTRHVVYSLAENYPEAAIHIIAREDNEDAAYRIAEEVREKKNANVYPHPEESFTLTDTLCAECGAVIVERKPWGIRIQARRGVDGRTICNSCGRVNRVLTCKTFLRRALHREIVVY